MPLTIEHITRVRALIDDAISTLGATNVSQARLAEFVPATRRFLFARKARFDTLGSVWPLGALLLSPTGHLHSAGEATRAVLPGHPGHVSAERERRREYTRIAFESGFDTGEVVYFDSPRIDLAVGASLPEHSALVVHEDRVLVRWNATASIESAVPIERYLPEQVALRIEREHR